MNEQTYSKEALLQSQRFGPWRDLLSALLSPEQRYTAQQAEALIQNYMKGEVK